MKKLVVALFMVLSFSLMGYQHAHAAVDYNKRPVELNVNGNFISMDVHPTMDNNRLFIPIRSLASLGIHYSWNPSSKVVTLQNKNGEYLKITVGSKVAYKGNQKIQMDQAAKNQDGRVLVPIRFVSEALGYHVDYETLRKMVFVNSDSYKFDMKQITQQDLQAARKAAISLPIKFDFQPLDLSGVYHEYSFPVGRADVYMLLDGRNETLVNIKDGKATAVG
ncbi:copper amine oxidase N-terminal domain-containing protein [Paenibacillus sp. GCM10027629]|uniref:copper amine oxidase N-terminal domain-containing protein n=1 Tax=Paenibacillus sp. GCM10027629 TaxID=3273414 RepID=UPI00363E6739